MIGYLLSIIFSAVVIMTFGAYQSFYAKSTAKESTFLKSIKIQVDLDSEAIERYKSANQQIALSFDQIVPYRKFNSFNTDFIDQSYLFESINSKQIISKCLSLDSGFFTQKTELLDLYVKEKSYTAYSALNCNKDFLIARDWDIKSNKLPDKLSIKIPLGSIDIPSDLNQDSSTSEPVFATPQAHSNSDNVTASEPLAN